MEIQQITPVNLIKLEMGSSLEDTNELIRILDSQFKKEESFGAIIVRKEEQSNVPESRKLFNEWLKAINISSKNIALALRW